MQTACSYRIDAARQSLICHVTSDSDQTVQNSKSVISVFKKLKYVSVVDRLISIARLWISLMRDPVQYI